MIRMGRTLLLAGMALAAAPALADDLRGALTMAYNTNPTLQAARSQQRAVDESVPIARSAALPSLSGTATYTEFVEKGTPSVTAPSCPERNWLPHRSPICSRSMMRASDASFPARPSSASGAIGLCAMC